MLKLLRLRLWKLQLQSNAKENLKHEAVQQENKLPHKELEMFKYRLNSHVSGEACVTFWLWEGVCIKRWTSEAMRFRDLAAKH